MTLEVQLRHQFEGFNLDVDFIAPKGVTALFGKSGAGKTSVVQAVAGLLRPDAGRIALGGTCLFDSAAGIDLPVHRRRLGYVFQDARLFPHMSVSGNLRYAARVQGRAVDQKEEARVVEMLGIGGLLARRPAGLSGGERQRVAIGRALLAAPELLLLDEPLAALDEARKAEILPYLERLRDEAGLPILLVSHAVSEVARLATTLVVLKEGRVVQAGPTSDILSDPEAVPALGVRHAGAVIRGRLVARHEDGLAELQTCGGALFLPGVGGEIGDILRVRIRAQDVILSREKPAGLSALNILKGRIVSLRSGEGPGVMVRIACEEEHVLARITRRSAAAMGLAEGDEIYAIVKSVSVAQGDIGG
ncbi:MAG: molybdenum ABC transporter ATP-binding protein [Rhodobacteraceae bacterium]|nr:molybdenum ABC transporter ATP-binding protein [Paracoccaceae bacterium]